MDQSNHHAIAVQATGKWAAIDALGERIAEQAAHIDAATHRLLTDIREFNAKAGHWQQGARTCAQWLSWRVGWTAGTAREHVRVAVKLGELPLIDDELRQGKVSYAKVRAMTRVATPANEEMLLEESRYCTGAQLEKICRKYAAVLRHDKDTTQNDDRQRRYVRQVNLDDGLVRFEAVLHAEEVSILWAAIEREAVARCREKQMAERAAKNVSAGTSSANDSTGMAHPQPEDAESEASNTVDQSRELDTRIWATGFDRADALVGLAQDVLRGTRKDRSPVEVVVTVAASTLREAAGAVCASYAVPAVAGTDHAAVLQPPVAATRIPDPADVACFSDGNCISADAARRLACDCGVVHVVEDDRGIPLSVGRRKRTIPASMKRAVLRRDQTCRFPGCNVRVFLEGHHLRHWADGGATSSKNIACLCSFHHRFVHEYGYTIKAVADGDFEFRTTRGVVVPAHPAPAWTPKLGFATIHEQNAALDIDSETLAYGWDGMPIDYVMCVDALIQADERAEVQH